MNVWIETRFQWCRYRFHHSLLRLSSLLDFDPHGGSFHLWHHLYSFKWRSCSQESGMHYICMCIYLCAIFVYSCTSSASNYDFTWFFDFLIDGIHLNRHPATCQAFSYSARWGVSKLTTWKIRKVTFGTVCGSCLQGSCSRGLMPCEAKHGQWGWGVEVLSLIHIWRCRRGP